MKILCLFIMFLTNFIACSSDNVVNISDEDALFNDPLDQESIDSDTSVEVPESEMVEVPAAEFMMGCNEAVDNKCNPDEYPYHLVMLDAFLIDKYEVTTGEYDKCVYSGSCTKDQYSDANYNGYCNLRQSDKWDHPMNCVSWFGAKTYCEWAGKRLPTEAEWEKAARGTDGRKYPWGNVAAGCGVAIMYGEDGDGCGYGGTAPVGTLEKGKSPYGVYDMAGNVSEWVNDWYAESYSTEPQIAPTGPDNGTNRGVRGGNFRTSLFDDYLRASARDSFSPDALNGSGIGFRCAK